MAMPVGTKLPNRNYGRAACEVCGAEFRRSNSMARICAPCRPENRRRWREENAEALKAANDAWRAPRVEEIKAKLREAYRQNSAARIADTTARQKRKMRDATPEEREAMRKRQAAYAREWRARNRERHREKRRAYDRKLRADPRGHLNVRFGNAVRDAIRGKKSGRRWETIVGYTLCDLMTHLERQFVKGMGWHNMGRWHIDHVRPLASFSFDTADCPGFKAAWALTNLRPLWAAENLKKGARRTLLI